MLNEDGTVFEIDHMQNIRSLLPEIKRGHRDDLTDQKLESVILFIDSFVTCTLLDPEVVDIVSAVNVHRHTRTCKKYNTFCRFNFPKFPSVRTIIATPCDVKFANESEEDKKKIFDGYCNLLQKVKDVLLDEERIKTICKVRESDLAQYMNKELSEEDL